MSQGCLPLRYDIFCVVFVHVSQNRSSNNFSQIGRQKHVFGGKCVFKNKSFCSLS